MTVTRRYYFFEAAAICLALFVFSASSALALTVNEVARELACPCECPLVLEDCNMSCGLDWKNQIGEKIKSGKGKDEIIGDFISRYGDACRITPMQRIHGKYYQYTRAFGTKEWAVLWAAVGVWISIAFLGIYLLVRKFTRKKSPPGDAL